MSAALKLEVFQNGQLLREVSLGTDEISLGRDENCNVRLDDRAISRKHAVFRTTPSGVEFEKKSKFGNIKINGKDSEQSHLQAGDRMEVGPYELRVKQELPPAPPVIIAETAPVLVLHSATEVKVAPLTREASAVMQAVSHEPVNEPTVEVNFSGVAGIEPMDFGGGAGEAAEAPISDGFEQAPPSVTREFDFAKVEENGNTKIITSQIKAMKAVLEFGEGTANVSTFEITDAEIAIGRSQKCHVVLEDKRSSRKHSVIRREKGKYFLKDLGSANGTLLNGLKVDEQELQSGDVLQIGDTEFVFKMLQADYEQKKGGFIQVPQDSAPVMHEGVAPQFLPLNSASPFHHQFTQDDQSVPVTEPTPAFEAPKEEKKSFIGKFLDRYRAMNTKQQIIYGIGILAVVWFMLDEDPVEKKAKLNTGDSRPKTAQTKKGDKKASSGPSFESLTPEQQRYIETQYQLGFDLFKNRDYDSALLEISKIFSLVQDFKNAREIEAFAREGKRKLEAQEEERKKKEQERQAQLKLQGLIEEVSMLMDKKRYKEAEQLFPEIELLQPENAAVSEWRKQMVAENERIEHEASEKKRMAGLNQAAWAEYEKSKELVKDHHYWDALDAFDLLLEREVSDKKFAPTVKAESKRVEDLISAERDPLLVQGKELEAAGKLTEAYRLYQKAFEIDSTHPEAPDGMKRIRGTLTGRAKSVYAEGVFAESYSDLDTAEKRYREVMEVVPNDDDYYLKAEKRLKKLTVFRRPATETPQ